jgi:hypothetical protein
MAGFSFSASVLDAGTNRSAPNHLTWRASIESKQRAQKRAAEAEQTLFSAIKQV